MQFATVKKTVASPSGEASFLTPRFAPDKLVAYPAYRL
jgi:hypothetical protein